ncbi:hypothetical protein H0H92_000666 [Tricholoma furcatifolium]|nr:hypothetical protein H0H92_000666 [Tricholoma furcatifolium]
MSLPPAKREISEHPAPNTVVDPVNRAARDADVDRKLRFYGIIEALRMGRLPTNKQIDHALSYISDHTLKYPAAPAAPIARVEGERYEYEREEGREELSRDGKKIMEDLREIVGTLKKMLHRKNQDELFQEFIWRTRDLGERGVGTRLGDRETREGMREETSASAAAASEVEKRESDNQQAIRHLRTLLSLVLTNSEVRKLFSDISVMGRDLLARGMTKAVSHIAPGAEELKRVDEPAPEGEFITDRPGEQRLEARVPGTNVNVAEGEQPGNVRVEKKMDYVGEGMGERDGAMGNMDDTTKPAGTTSREVGIGQIREGKHVANEEARKAKEGAAGAMVGDDTRGPISAGMQSADTERLEGTARGIAGDEPVDRTQEGIGAAKGKGKDIKEGNVHEVEVEQKKQGFMERMRGMRDTFAERTAQDERVERGKKFFTEEYFPAERRDQFIYRGKKVILECQKHDDYQEALKWLLAFIGGWAAYEHTQVKSHGKQARAFTEDERFRGSLRDLRTLLERFANNQSMDPILDSISALSDDAHRDTELRRWFNEVNDYVHQALLEPGYVLDDACNHRANELRESGRRFYDGKYKGHFDRLFDSTGAWFSAMGEDPINKQFGEDWAVLTRDLLFDSEGNLQFKKDLWNDVRHVLLPQIIDKVGYIPIPRIEYTDESLDLVVENLTLSGRNLFPNIILLEAHNFIKFSPYRMIPDEGRHRFTLGFGQMQADMRDVAFYYRKKTGMAKIKDSGIADVLIGGEGVGATVVLASAGKDQSSVFKVHSVHVSVDSLKFSIRDSKHDLLYKTLRPLATGLIKRQIQKAIRDAITTGLEYVDGQLVGVRDKMEAARAEGKEGGRERGLREMFRSRKEKEDREAASTMTTSTSHSQFKVVADKRQSILSTEGHPAGWINRTQEKAQMAREGEGWRSDA